MQFDERRYRPLTTIDLFDEAFDLYKRNFVLFLSIVAIVIVPSTIVTDVYSLKMVNAMIGKFADGNLASAADPTSALSTMGDFVREAATQSAIFYVVMLIPWTLSFLAITSAVSARYLDRPESLLSSYVSSFRQIIPGVIGAITFTIAVNIGVLIAACGLLSADLAPLFILAGLLVELFASLVVIAKYPLFMGAIVNEKVGAFKGLKRSADLTKGDSGRIVWTLICLSILTVSVSGAVEGVLELMTGGIVNSSILIVPILANNRIVAGQIADGLAGMLLTPYAMIVLTLLYFDQRIRKEGYDMDILAAGLGYEDVVPGTQTAYAPALSSAPPVRVVRAK